MRVSRCSHGASAPRIGSRRVGIAPAVPGVRHAGISVIGLLIGAGIGLQWPSVGGAAGRAGVPGGRCAACTPGECSMNGLLLSA